MRSRDYFPPSRQSRDRRRTFWIIVGILAALAVVLVLFPGALSNSGHPHNREETTTTAITLSHVSRTYEAVLSQYDAAFVSPNVAIASATADIAKQEQRAAQNDASSYTFHKSGSECSGDVLDPGQYQTCLNGEHLSADSVLSDENAANQAKNADVSRQVTSVQEIEAAISAFAQELQDTTWPSSVSPAVTSLEEALSAYQRTYAQSATDLNDGQPISANSQAVSAAASAVNTELGDMATTLGIPATTTPTTS